MSSAPAAGDAPEPRVDLDQTGRARIRDAAIALFGERGYEATTMRAIAERADVSAALVVHHFGSKQGLRDAVDDHLVMMIRDGKFGAMTGSPMPTGDEYARMASDQLAAMLYLGRALADGSEVGFVLYERLYRDALEYLQAGVDAGLLHPGQDPAARAAVLLNHGLSQLLLLPHLQRVLGTSTEVETAMRTAAPTLDLYIDGLFTDDRFRVAWRAESQHVARTADPDPPTQSPVGPDVE